MPKKKDPSPKKPVSKKTKEKKVKLPKDFGKISDPDIIYTSKEIKVDPPSNEENIFPHSSRNKMGRPLKINECKEEIIESLRKGAPIKDAIAGFIHKCTYIDWLTKGKEDLDNNIKSDYSDFSIRTEEAQKEYRDQLRATIEMHSAKDWKAASWLLERSDPENYVAKQKVDVTTNGENVNFYIPSNQREEDEDE
jgi:hypothetical protein